MAVAARTALHPASSPARGPRRRTALTAVPPKGKRPRLDRRRRRALVVASLSLACGSLLAVTGSYAYLTEGQVHLARIEDQLARQSEEQRQLELQVSELEQPSNVMTQAKRQGLVVPTTVTDLQQVSLSPVQGRGTRSR